MINPVTIARIRFVSDHVAVGGTTGGVTIEGVVGVTGGMISIAGMTIGSFCSP
jgi:hypothetical protein